MSSEFDKYMNKKHPGIFTVHETVPKSQTEKSSKDNGDLTNLKTIDNFAKHFSESKADLVTADGGFDWKDENYQEQEAYKLIMGQILGAVKIQAKGGNFVLKIFDIFTPITIKFLYILGNLYEDVFIHKPFTSRSSNSEKYIICKKFKFDHDKKLDIKITFLETMLNNLQTDIFVNDLITNFELTDDFRSFITYMNIKLINIQQMQINRMIEYIDSNNHYGEKFHNYVKKQKESTKFWLDLFYPKSGSEHETQKDNIDKLLTKSLNTNEEDIKLQNKKLEYY
jgi:hypothetical protein